MTVCLALHAIDYSRKDCIVLCCDAQVGDDFSTWTGDLKCDLRFADRLVAMYAGTLEDVNDLIESHKTRFRLSKCDTKVGLKEELMRGMGDFQEATDVIHRMHIIGLYLLEVTGFGTLKDHQLFTYQPHIDVRPRDFLFIDLYPARPDSQLGM